MQITGWNGAVGDGDWWARALSFATALGVVVALLGPYGSFYNKVLARLADWIAIFLVQTVIMGSLLPLVVRLGTARRLSRPFSLGLGLAFGAIPGSAAAGAISSFFWGKYVSDYRWYDWYFQTLLLDAILIALWASVEVARLSTVKRDQPVEPRKNAGSDDLICLQMEDHYVRVHRTTGSYLELMALKDAIGRYGSSDGLQVHRSWWVEARAVQGMERDARTWKLRLKNQLLVPIARNRIHSVRQRGWLKGA